MKKVALIVLICAAFFSSCGITNPGSPSASESPSPQSSPAAPVTVIGTVVSQTTGEAIANATISVGSKSARSDASGNFSFNAETVAEGVQARVESEGYVLYQKPLAAASGGTIRLDAILLPETPAVVINPAIPNIVTSPEGASVTLPVLAGITEPLAVSVTYIDAGSSAIGSAPGDFSGIGTGGTEACLVSRGMIDVKVTGVTTGTDYSLAGMGTYEISVPIPSNLDTAVEGSTIPMWYFDEEQGKWIEEGVATKVGSAYVGNVTHFTTWNMDFKDTQLASISGVIVDPVSGSTDSCYMLSVTFPGFSTSRSSGVKGPFSIVRLPCAITMNISIQNTLSGEIISKVVTTPSSSENIEIGDFVFHEQYFPAVLGLMARQVDGDIRVTWHDPALAGLDTVTVTCEPYDGSGPLASQSVTAGVESATFSVATKGYYTITATGNYSGGNSSTAVSTYYKFIRAYDFQLAVDIDPAFPTLGVEVYITPEGNTGRFLYTGGVLTYPGDYQLRIDVVETNLPLEGSYRFDFYNQSSGTIDYIFKEDYSDIDHYVAIGDDDYDLVLHYLTYYTGSDSVR
jgi:hypothetical protein